MINDLATVLRSIFHSTLPTLVPGVFESCIDHDLSKPECEVDTYVIKSNISNYFPMLIRFHYRFANKATAKRIGDCSEINHNKLVSALNKLSWTQINNDLRGTNTDNATMFLQIL